MIHGFSHMTYRSLVRIISQWTEPIMMHHHVIHYATSIESRWTNPWQSNHHPQHTLCITYIAHHHECRCTAHDPKVHGLCWSWRCSIHLAHGTWTVPSQCTDLMNPYYIDCALMWYADRTIYGMCGLYHSWHGPCAVQSWYIYLMICGLWCGDCSITMSIL